MQQKELTSLSVEALGIDLTVDWVLWVYIHKILDELDFVAGINSMSSPHEIWILKSLKKRVVS